MGIDLGRFRSDKDKSEWVDWLADDPVPASIRGKMRAKAIEEASRPVVRRPGQQLPSQQSTQVANSEQRPATVSINISIPHFKLKKPSIKIPTVLHARKKRVFGGLAGVVLVAGVATAVLVIAKPDKGTDKPGVLAETTQKADFAYSLPKGSTEGLDGAVKYDGQRKVVNYKDSIGGVEITISQQPLPEAFRQDPAAKVKKMAEEFSATKTIATANPTAYIGTSAKGPQTVIFSKKDLLVFIQSAKSIDDHDWAEYITNLQ